MDISVVCWLVNNFCVFVAEMCLMCQSPNESMMWSIWCPLWIRFRFRFRFRLGLAPFKHLILSLWGFWSQMLEYTSMLTIKLVWTYIYILLLLLLLWI
jgi:hypothetical protein